MYGFIYITTNNVNGKQYIGQKKYVKGWESYLGSGIALCNAIKKYGVANFTKEIIEECDNADELNEREIYWIDFHKAVTNKEFYNIAYGGDGGNTTSSYSKEEKFAIYSKSNKDKNKGSANARAKKVVCLNTNEVFETIQQASEKYNISPTSISRCCDGCCYTSGQDKDGTRLQWCFYKDIYNKQYVNNLKRIYHTKSVLCITTNTTYKSVKEASRHTNCREAGIRNCCNGFLKTTNKLQWKYVEN